MIRDLSHPITTGMTVYPGDPTVHLEPALEVAADGAAVTAVRMGSHTGTHIDAPAHTVAGGRTMADVPLDELVGDALIVRVREVGEGEVYGWAQLTEAAPVPDVLPPIVVIDTGWAAWFGDERALRHPVLDPSAARELVARGMRILAVDTLNPDRTDAAATVFPVHEVVLGAGGLIVENLTGLDGLPPRVRMGLFPLALQGDGAPVRAVAFLDTD